MSGKRRPTSEGDSLADLVREYLGRKGSGPRLDAYLDTFRKCSLAEAIERAGYVGENVHPHQRRLGRKKLAQAAKALLKKLDVVQKCRSFEELHELVGSCTRHIDRFGALARYDVALRIGAHLGVWPELIYLHAGTAVGCKKLGIPCQGKTVEPEELPAPIRRLGAYHAENFLCIYKGGFGCVGRVRRSSC